MEETTAVASSVDLTPENAIHPSGEDHVMFDNRPPSVGELVDLTMDEEDDHSVPTGTVYPASERVKVKVEKVEPTEDPPALNDNSQDLPMATPDETLDSSRNPDQDTASTEDVVESFDVDMSDWQRDSGRRAQEYHNMLGENSNDDAVQDTAEKNFSEERNMFDDELDEEALQQAFQICKARYNSRVAERKNTLEEDIDFKKAEDAEAYRIRLRDRRQRDGVDDDNEDSLFMPEVPSENPRGPPRVDLTNESDIDQDDDQLHAATSMHEDDDFLQEFASIIVKKDARKRGRPKASTRGRVTKPAARKSRGQPTKKARAPSSQQPQLDDPLANLFSNVVTDAQANHEKGVQPAAFLGGRRDEALKEYLASMPEDQRDLANKKDKSIIEDAVKHFKNCRLDGIGTGWKFKGMKSSLHNHQVIGAAFMRKREGGKTVPRGGMLSDEMGFGKTIMTIAAILDGKSEEKARSKATLIVATPALATQWLQEIQKHAGDSLGNVLLYRSGARLMSNAPVAMLSSMDVVITTYQEIMRSMPKNQPPVQLCTKQAKDAWWRDQLATKKGILHQVNWHRIVLDEAQAIKNRASRTFEAVFELQGKYRWAISGTPVQNSLDEFYPYFAYLRMPETGDFGLWKKNFNKKGSEVAFRRLARIVNGFMLRRTHASRLFGAPCLKLPNIEVDKTEVKFNEIESEIYHIVRLRFMERIKGLCAQGGPDRNYQFLFVLLLRLRQMTAHILLIQKTLKDLLEPEDLESLWKLCGEVRQRGLADTGDNEILNGLEKALANVQPGDPSTQSGFDKFMQAMRKDGTWEKRLNRSVCPYCGHPPQEPCITACRHIYCKVCLDDLDKEASLKNMPAKCLTCFIEYSKSRPCTAYDEAGTDHSTVTSVRSGLLYPRRQSSTEEEDIDWYTIGGPVTQSAKTRAATDQIRQWLLEDPTAKILVFTQFRGIIKIMNRICNENNWGCADFHGAMSMDARDASIERFCDDRETKILLMSLKAGGVGLNLTAANRCIIIDLWWNNSVEQQAFCRMFRIGQTRDVKVVRLALAKSIDDEILEMQDRKLAEIAPVVEPGLQRGAPISTRELLGLFGPELERDAHGTVTAGAEDEPFLWPQRTWKTENRSVE